MKIQEKNMGITSPKGFIATGANIGIKKNKEKNDLTLLVSECPAACAGVFTKNPVHAAPVAWGKEIISKGTMVRGILVNSGNANACTGQQGIDDNKAMAQTFGDLLGVTAEEILVCSTGVIGVPLPMNVIVPGIKSTFPSLGRSETHGDDAANGIMTTDTFSKTITVTIELSGQTVTISGMAKGSGMVHPNMATLLAFITTDAAISTKMLQKALSDVTLDTYNMISVDGDTSTNDTLLALANGMAGNPIIEEENEDYKTFKNALYEVNKKLAIDIAKDGEGASKLLEAVVTGAKTKEDARIIARSVISSLLVKAAMYGADANWGRVLCAMGYSGGEFNVQNVDIDFESTAGTIGLMRKGAPIPFSEELALKILNEKHIIIKITLYDGDKTATAWGCDLTYEYVKINGEYRS